VGLFLANRFFIAIFQLLFISFVTFSIMKINFTVPAFAWQLEVPFVNQVINLQASETHIQAGDPLADLKLNPAISENRIEAEKKRLGLDKPFGEQYLTWLQNVMQGEFGLSQNNQRVTDLLYPALRNTLLLNIVVLVLSWLIAIPLGIVAAIQHNKFLDNLLKLITSITMSMPGFIFAIFMLLVALQTGWFPIGGLTSSYYDELNLFEKFLDISCHLALPVLILTILSFAGIQRQMRSNLLDVLKENYIRTARAKGLPERKVFFKHAFRNAINPLVTILGYEFAGLFMGSALIEMILAYPGLGYLTLEAALKLDINVVLATLMLSSLMLVLGNLLADLLLAVVDPRVGAS